VCLLSTSCTAWLPLQNTINGTRGLGIGGLLTVGKAGTVRFSVENAPWTLGKGSGTFQTHEGAFIPVSKTGFVHNASSNMSSSSVGSSKVVQLVASQQVTTLGVAGNSTKMTLFATLTLHFVPEPGLFLLISSGIVGLSLMGRSRMKK